MLMRRSRPPSVAMRVIWWAGSDRYAVSATVSSANFARAMTQGTILLMRKDPMPATVRTELERLDPDTIVILGGPGSVSAVPALDGAADQILLLHIPRRSIEDVPDLLLMDLLVHIVDPTSPAGS